MFDIINKLRKKWHVPKNKTDEQIYSTFAFPLTKRIYPSLASSTMINVQPMQAPSGNIFTTTYIYGTASCSGPLPQSKPLSTQGSNMHEILTKDILKNWENIESVLYDIPQIKITLKSVPITAQRRKLKLYGMFKYDK